MTESGNILRDIHRLTAFSLGSSMPKGVPAQTGTDLPQYLTLFDSIEVESLNWQTKDPKRFSRFIWNEAVYLMQRENPDFKFRVEGKVHENVAAPELIVFVLDTKKNIDALGSDAILTAKKKCTIDNCSFELRIDYKNMARNFELLESAAHWAGTSGNLTARVTETNTTAEFTGLVFSGTAKLPIAGDRKIKINFEKVDYNRTRSTDTSQVDARGSYTIEGTSPEKFVLKGNLRDASSISFTSWKE